MIHCTLKKEVVKMLESRGRLRAVLADLSVLNEDTGEVENNGFRMNLPIEQMEVEGPKGRAIVFYQEELRDYCEGDTDRGNIATI